MLRGLRQQAVEVNMTVTELLRREDAATLWFDVKGFRNRDIT